MERTIRGNYFAKCAIDHAVYDITGKALGISAAKVLGGMHNTKFYVGRSLPLGTPKEVTEKAKEFIDNGYRMLTLKGGIDYKNEIECFKMTRKVVGEDFMLEIDPIGGYDRATALKTIEELEQYNLQSIEQPIAGIDVEGMAELRRKVNTPIIADESVFTMYDLTNIIEKKAALLLISKKLSQYQKVE
ncbi:MAG: mandelate racemase/muconate lactonizing enzyme family protein [Rickettsia endosymbiont of Labidopullus appendiculatus]|nr:mandelate racemase/muconate lactonizing enzyme family protein [Rickettsia endosymbiont of Labidopullus appendiculatus]